MHNTKFIKALLVVSFLTLFNMTSQASVLINGSFEDNTIGAYLSVGGGDSSTITGWTTINSGVELFTTTEAADGSYVVDLNNFTYQSGGIEQMFATVIGQSYTFSFAATTLQGFGRDGTGQVDVSIGADSHSYFLENHFSTLDWETHSFVYVATDTTTTLAFSNSTDSLLNFSYIDGISGDITTVPVPAAVWLLGSGLLCLFGTTKSIRTRT